MKEMKRHEHIHKYSLLTVQGRKKLYRKQEEENVKHNTVRTLRGTSIQTNITKINTIQDKTKMNTNTRRKNKEKLT